MNALERLGLEVVAFTLLGSRAQAALLLVLVEGNGRQVSIDKLAEARIWRKSDDDGPSRKGLMVRMCVLRSSLADLGFPGVIKTVGNETVMCPATGYSLPEPGRSAVLARLIEEAG